MSVSYGGDKITFSDSSTLSSAHTGFKNRVINGDMRIDQRNSGSAVSWNATGIHAVDRFRSGAMGQTWGTGVVTAQQSTTVPAGFKNSLKLTVATADASLAATDGYGMIQVIEGLNVADLNWGTANAAPVAISFWVQSSITGTYAFSLANNATDRSYVATYTINSANTWEYKTIAIAGDTTGTWLTDNGAGVNLRWDLGSGSNIQTATTGAWQTGNFGRTSSTANWISTSGATFLITGVQFERGSVASQFEFRPLQDELQYCQRYFEMSFNQGQAPANGLVSYVKYMSSAITTGGAYGNSPTFAVEKRASATMTIYRTDNGGTNGQPAYFSGGTWNNANSMSTNGGTRSFNYNFLGTFTTLSCLYTDFQWTASAEL